MAFQVSPGVSISEVDLSTVVPAVSTTAGAIAGPFRWGPVDERVLISSEVELVRTFGKPKTNYNIETFFTAADFLAYSNQLQVVRTSDGVQSNLTTGGGVAATVEYVGLTGVFQYQGTAFAVTNIQDPDDILSNLIAVDGQPQQALSIRTGGVYVFDLSDSSNAGVDFKLSITEDGTNAGGTNYIDGVIEIGTPGQAGAYVQLTATANTPAVLYYYNANEPSQGGSIAKYAIGSGHSFTVTKSSTDYTVTVVNGGQDFRVGDRLVISGEFLGGVSPTNDLTVNVETIVDPNNDDAGSIASTSFTGVVNPESVQPVVTHIRAKYPGKAGDSIRVDVITQGNFNTVDSGKYFDAAPVTDALHFAVIDATGEFTTSPGSVLEVYENVSVTPGTQLADGTNVYYKDVINLSSNYIVITDEAEATQIPTGENLLANGDDGNAEGTDAIVSLQINDYSGYGLFKHANEVDISLILQGKAAGGAANTTLTNFLVEEVAAYRKDAVAFVSPPRSVIDVARSQMTNAIINFANSLSVGGIAASYGFMDSGYKYRYDKYNDKYVYVPMNGDMAGLCVRTDSERDSWFSPAGYNRGFVKNIIKLPYNPNQAERDALYKKSINPVISQPGQGVLLFGDRTMADKSSAFDRINVRRLFIILEKAVATASQFTLFEFNDEFTRAQFVNLIEPFLRDIQGRRGIYDYRVVCDETNNTPEIIDRNEFVGDIYVKPARSVNFIRLNFVSVRTGVEFEEIVGRN